MSVERLEEKGNHHQEHGEAYLRKEVYLYTHSPLHIGAGSALGAIDLPILRERHTQFPIVSGSTLKGVFADLWIEKKTEKESSHWVRSQEGKWLFGDAAAEEGTESKAGCLLFSEAKLLAFPVRSAKGCFAWITSPLILSRYQRDIGREIPDLKILAEIKDNQAYFLEDHLGIDQQLILEEYTFAHAGNPPQGLLERFRQILAEDPLWETVKHRLAIVSDTVMSFFARFACEVAQHVCIDDQTGAAKEGALFNQENVPSETMFYFLLHAFADRKEGKSSDQAWQAFQKKVQEKSILQFGADAGTGLGFCRVIFNSDFKGE